MAVTLKELGNRIGVSPATVSLALRDDPRIAERTRNRVKALAEEMGYFPNPFGKSLQANRSGMIAFVGYNQGRAALNEFTQILGIEAMEKGYGLMVAMDDHISEEKPYYRLFRQKHIEGLIVCSYDKVTIDEIKQIEDSGIPVVILDNISFDPEIPHVALNDEKAATLLIDHLTELGHKRFAFSAVHRHFEKSMSAINEMRLELLANLLRERDLPEPMYINLYRDILEFLDNEQPPTAVVALSDDSSVHLMQNALQRGVRIPQDLSITGYDNIHMSSWPEYSLTTIEQPRQKMGETAMQLLLDRIEGRDVESVLFDPQLVVRESTGLARN